MEKQQKLRQYEYRQNSNLVLTLNPEGGRREIGPSSEVMSLAGKADVKTMTNRMGDRASHSKPEGLAEEKKKKAKRDDEEPNEPRKRKRAQGSVLTADVDAVYRPQTRETRLAYEVLLQFIQAELGDKPHDVVRSCADEVLAVLKEDGVKDKEKQVAIESLFSAGLKSAKKMDIEKYSKLVNIGKKITDFATDNTANAELEGKEGAALEDAHGVPVIFDDEERKQAEDEKDASDEEKEDEEEEEELKEERRARFNIEAKDDGGDDDDDKSGIDIRTIDAYWIQRQVSQFEKDALKSQKQAEEIYVMMSSDRADNDVENSLVLSLGYDNFNFIRTLMKNRLKVVYCTKLARAKDDEKKAIEKEMAADPKLKAILDKLHRTTTATDRNIELEKKLIGEARSLAKSGRALAVTDDGESKGELKLGSGTTDAFWSKKPKAVLDLDSLAFEQGGHFMASDTKIQMPKGSEVINKKGYKEIHIPAAKAQGMAPDEKAVTIEEMPSWAQKAFPGMKTLNRVQSRVYDVAFKTPENMLLCAPTGAGKTNVAMLTMLHEIGLNRREDGTINTDAFKIIYVAPMKSLVQEMVQNFTKRLEPYGIVVKELSGDQQLTKQQIAETQLIVTTPEKWDIITRKAGDRTYTQQVKLVIIDEIHLLHDARGPVLESIVSRTIRQIETTQELIRLVGLSATLPNYEDVAMFLRVKADKGLFFFDNSFRPCPLQMQFIGVTQTKAFKRTQLMDEILYEKVTAAAGKNQVMIFVHSRKDTANTARAIRDKALELDDLGKFCAEDSGRRELLKTEAEGVKSEALKEILPYGFAIHHAGMHRTDRTLVEELFADGHIQVLVSTATLAWGVNLPAHTVIIKGTQVYSPEKGRWVELSPMDVMQMLGRAGRPQYDTHGEGMILTSYKELSYYLSLLNQQLPVESQFISKLPDNLNAEIVLGSISNLKEAVQWLGYSYLYVRMLRKPSLYGISHEEAENDPRLEQRRIDLIHTAASLLDKHNLIKYDRKTGNFQVTDLGRVASHYYITHSSMAVYNEYLKPTMSDIELFRVFSLSAEFKHMTVREEEKMELAKLLDKVPIPVKESIEEPTAKVNVLLQAFISRLKLEGFALQADMVFITQSAGRLMRALAEIVLKRGWASATNKTLSLCKMVNHRMWAAQSPLRQFTGIPSDIIKRIEGKDFPWDRFYDLEPQAIGELIRFAKMGKPIHRAVHQLPRLDLQGHVQPITRAVLRVELTITPDFQWDEKVHGDAEPFWIIVEDVDSETILHHEYFILKKKFATQEHSVSFTIPIFDPLPPQYYIRVTSDRWLGSEVVLPISFRHLILPEKYPPPTELLDLQPLSITELANEKYISLYSRKFEHFNPIQTQVFNVVYRRDDNVMLAAPTGSGKTVVAELAIMRMLTQQGRDARCVYIAPLEALAVERLRDWVPKFGRDGLGYNVAQLTGETTADLRLLSEAQVVISTPQIWDELSRRWKTRKPVQDVRLFIVDELHLIGNDNGEIIEVIVSRMRYMATQTEQPLRIIGLSTSVANAKDLGDWIGASGQGMVNFHPNVRPVPLEIRVQGFDINDFNSRQLAMVKPTYMNIVQHSPSKPALVFVPSRIFARSVALDILTYAASEGDERRFLRVDPADLEPHLKHISNKTLQQTLVNGVGFYHAGMTDKEKLVVERLFNMGAIQVVVAEYALCWGMTMSAHLVVIMGTQSYDGREHRYVDCPITDVIQMMGRASRPTLDTTGKCTILCHGPKKEFYKKFLYEPFPVESHLDHFLADHLNAEIITKRVETVQECVDYLTWSFFYRRIQQNPNYYNLQGTSHRHISDHLSELIENTLDDLVQAKCVALEDETDLSPLNLGMIAAYYYIRYTTVELFSTSLAGTSKLKGLLEILSSASEFERIPVLHKEDYVLKKLAHHLPLKITDAKEYTDAHTKANVLLQAHFSRVPLTAGVKADQDRILPDGTRLLQAMVDVISSNGWLSPALACMELSQMITQGLWNTDGVLLQVPHITPEHVKTLEGKYKVESVGDLMDMDDDDRNAALKLPPAKLQDIARFCNGYPDVSLTYEIEGGVSSVVSGDKVIVNVDLERDDDDTKNGIPIVVAPRYPSMKTEGWWLVIGNIEKNELVCIKRVSMKKSKMRVKMDFNAPTVDGSSSSGALKLMLYLMSDSYLGCDQEYAVKLNVTAAATSGDKAGKGGDDSDDDMAKE